MTDTDSTPVDVHTWIMRAIGTSREDAELVVDRVASAVISDQQQQAMAPPTPPDRLNVMRTVEGVGDNQVVRNWVNVEAVTQEVVEMMTAFVADALMRVMGGEP